MSQQLPGTCPTCIRFLDYDGVKLCSLVYAPGGRGASSQGAATWLNANMDRRKGVLKPDAVGCPVYGRAQ